MRIQKFLDTSHLFGLSVTFDQILDDFQARLAVEGVHFLQALILTGLFFEERPVRPSDLARTLRAKKSNLSHALRGLERNGLIERATAAHDARAYYFSLTREGRRRVPRLIKLFDQVENHIEAAAGPRRIRLVLDRFQEIYRGVSFPD